MRRTAIALVFGCILAAIVGCDGGSRGSGITTAEGNVDSVQTARRDGAPASTMLARWRAWLPGAAAAHAQAELEGIRVFVAGTTLTTETDADGRFRLRGNFDGDVVIRFQRSPDTTPAAIAVNAPAGGTLTLNDVHVDERSGVASARSQEVAFEGLVARTQCPDQSIRMVSRQRGPTDTDVYVIRLDTSSLHDSQGTPLACESLVEGDPLRVAGSVESDGAFGNADIVLER
jgi:hypothetical protein